jgi:hypothetical protein
MADQVAPQTTPAEHVPSLAELHRELDELTEQIDRARHHVHAEHRHAPSLAEGWSGASEQT